MGQSERPLSPHLQVYRPQLNSVMSISHRLTGLFLGAGAVFMSVWLISLAGGPTQYAAFQEITGSILGKIILFLWTFSIFYHLCNGIRHLFWDSGHGYELNTAYVTGWVAIIVSLLLTAGLWLWILVESTVI